MTISYNWLNELVPELPEPEKLSEILTSVGLEVESLEKYEEIKGNLDGLIIGEVSKCERHPGADNLQITIVEIGSIEKLQIVCGAPNVAEGKKVVVAPAGCTIYPINSGPVTMKIAKIRGVESQGMICAEDEIGIGTDHEGIIILPESVETGSKAADYFKPLNDWIYEIGLTPNRIDAMSHIGVAKDVCAYLSHHNNKPIRVISPFKNNFKVDNNNLPIEVIVENTKACERYTGVSIINVKVEPAPKWLQKKLKSIGLRPVNNIVDITNYILHETGQPLHAFDANAIKGNKIIVKNLKEGTEFITLDEKPRKLQQEDLMICNGDNEPMCFGGVFGGLFSGVKDTTTNIFLESAWFHPATTRKTSLRHNLRTDAAIRFEKGVDISQTAHVLKKAAMMIKEIAGGQIASEAVDVYPVLKQKKAVVLKYEYLKKISGKIYKSETVKSILQSLGFQIEKDDLNELLVLAPFSKPDVTLPADVVEEIMRIDGFDNVAIPFAVTISPEIESRTLQVAYKEKTGNYLTGSGFSEIFTNSITNSAYFEETVLKSSVKIVNSLSADLDIMRPGLLQTGLECVLYNLNRKNNDLLFFEFGNAYSTTGLNNYVEHEHLALYVTGKKSASGWRHEPAKSDLYFLKGIIQNIFTVCGLQDIHFTVAENMRFEYCLTANIDNKIIAEAGMVSKHILEKFSIKQPVFYADLFWEEIMSYMENIVTKYTEINKFPSVSRDISIVVKKAITYKQVEGVCKSLNINKLTNLKLFDVFESDKLGADKKALALNLTFSDKEKTLTDKEIEDMMKRIMVSFETGLGAEIRKGS